MSGPKVLKSVRFYERIADAIRDEIVGGQWKEGDRLPNERDIAARFGVSRPVVREAIRALAHDGLVTVRQGSGTFVADATNAALGTSLGLALAVADRQQGLKNLVELRGLFEPSVAALAAEQANESDLAAMADAITTMDACFEDVDRFIAADHRFHLDIARATHNPLVPTLLEPIVEQLNEQRRRIFFVPHSARSAQDFHRLIYNAIAAHDPVAARAVMRSHLSQVSGDVAHLEAAITNEPAPQNRPPAVSP